MSILGFLDHAPYPDNRFGLRMHYEELDEYIENIKKLKNKFSDKLRFVLASKLNTIRKNLHTMNSYLMKRVLSIWCLVNIYMLDLTKNLSTFTP